MTGLDLGFGRWLLTVAAGALLGLDGVSWPQSMASRPIVSATLGGWLFGDPGSGFLVGAVLEFASLRHPPYGAAFYPETGPAGLVAGAALASTGGVSAGPFLVALLCGWTIGWIGTRTVHLQRLSNETLVARWGSDADLGRLLPKRHRAAIRIDLLRAGVVTAAFLVPAILLCRIADRMAAGSNGFELGGLLLGIALLGFAGGGAGLLTTRRAGWAGFAAALALSVTVGWVWLR